MVTYNMADTDMLVELNHCLKDNFKKDAQEGGINEKGTQQ